MFCTSPQLKTCVMCLHPINVKDDKVTVENHNMHKVCFRCAICDEPLVQGSCAVDHVLYRYFGPMFFCHTHMMMGSGEKHDLLKKKFPVRNQ